MRGHYRRRRRHTSVFREARRLCAMAFAGWLLVGGTLTMIALAGSRLPPPTTPVASRNAAHGAAQITGDEALVGQFNPWWSIANEPNSSTSTATAIAPTTFRQAAEPKAPVSKFVAPDFGNLTLAPADGGGTTKFLPILYWHHPPEDFDRQLTWLDQHNYHVVSLDAAVAGLNGSPLPDRPVVLTFDDGFTDQMSALPILQAHHMTATFYIINGGSGSTWCIGANRRYNDPAQPPQGCGDAYLTWDQVRAIDASGVGSIGGHTLDHPDLPTLSADEQFHEIADSKTEIEQEIGHPIYHFAYPYGSYNATTIAQVQRAGFVSATTTRSGTNQTAGGRFVMHRQNSAYGLPE